MTKKTRNMILNRNHTLTSIYGHSVKFKKGEPTFVPSALYPEALAIGASFEDGEELEHEETHVQNAPVDPAERKAAILAAVKAIVARNDNTEFTAAGAPKVDAVNKEADFNVSAKEIAVAWQAYHDEKAQGEDE